MIFNTIVAGSGGGIKLDSIAVTTPPTKTSYLSGERFDPTGMVVTATYSNGAKLAATGYAVEPSGPLSDGMTSVTIRYTEGGVTCTALQPITVIHRLESISVTTLPEKMVYEYGDAFSDSGMVVKATYSDGAVEIVSSYSCSPGTFTTIGAQDVTVSYTERGVTKTTLTSVTVERKRLAAVPSQIGSLTYSGSALTPSWSNYNTDQLTISGETSATNAGDHYATFTPTANYRWSDGTTTGKQVAWTIGKAAGSLSITPPSLTLDSSNPTGKITVTRAGNGTITAESSDTSVATVSVSGTVVTVSGVNQKSGSAVITIKVSAGTNHTAPSNKTCAVTVSLPKIYGVQWDGTSTTAWTRTDDAALFTDPVPYVKGATSYGSPFDNLQPWAGMVRVTDSEAGELVAIPKFYYKWTKSGNMLKLQIADGQVDGFYVSPAHADRGDGKGERDVVYVGRYHCHTSNYKSQTGGKPKESITRSAARSGIHNLGATIWQFDYAMRLTIQMLYLVEFADWNSQTKIGYGCGNNSVAQNVGASDSMPYHTGTMQTSRKTYGVGVQYRYIEGLWDNVYDWMDGCYYNSNGLNIIMNPNNFSDSANGTLVGKPSSGYPTVMSVADASGVQWMYPTTANGSKTTYIPDYWSFNASRPCLYCGGGYNQSLDRGLFCVSYSNTSYSNTNIGCRLQKLP